MLDEAPLLLDAVVLRRRQPRPGNRFFARDVQQWWFYPPTVRLRNDMESSGKPDPGRLPMLAVVLPPLGPVDRGDLAARLADQRRGMPLQAATLRCRGSWVPD